MSSESDTHHSKLITQNSLLKTISVRLCLSGGSHQFGFRDLAAVRRMMHRDDRFHVELQAIDVVDQIQCRRIDRSCDRRVWLSGRVESVRLDKNLLLGEIGDDHSFLMQTALQA